MNKVNKNQGFSLMETVVAIALFLIIGVTIYSVYADTFKLIRNSQTRILATALINEQVELIRNLSYVDVGIVGGSPVGTVEAYREITKGIFTFGITTDIDYIDDPFDGLGGADTIGDNNDYKLVEIILSCVNCVGFGSIQFNTFISSD